MALPRKMGSPRRARNPLRGRGLRCSSSCDGSRKPSLVLHVEASSPRNYRLRSPSSRIRSNGLRKIRQAKPGPPRLSTSCKDSFWLHRISRAQESNPDPARLGRTPRNAVRDTTPAKRRRPGHHEHLPYIRLSTSSSSSRKNHSRDYQGIIPPSREHPRDRHDSLLGTFPGRRGEESLPSISQTVPRLAHASELQTDEGDRAGSL